MVSGDRSTSPPLLISSSEWDKFLVFGDGCMHTRLTFNLKTAGGVRNFRSYMEEATDLVVSYGGSLSGEHGDGQAKGELLPKMFGSDLMQAFREFKSIWDPHWRMNPGKVVDAYPLDSNLRAGPDYRPQPVFTHSNFPKITAASPKPPSGALE